MAEQVDRERHNLNLSRQVWGELKLRSFQEGMSASDLVAYIVERFTRVGYSTLRLPRYQQRNSDEDRLGRTVFFPTEVWQQAQLRAAERGTSISSLVEYLIKQYLGLLPESDLAAREEESNSSSHNTLRIGEERVYLGENPVRIDLKTGKPK